MSDIHIQTLVKSGAFKSVDRQIYPRIVAAITAQPKEGKTHLMLDAPGPIAVFDSDYGLEGVVSKFPDKEILAYRVPMPDPGITGALTAHMDEFTKIDNAYTEALANPSVRTIAIDTSTEIWEIVRLAYLGRLEKVISRDYGPANGAMRRFLKKALDSDKNLILVQKMKQEYKNDKATGNWLMSGFNDVAGIVQVVMRPFYAREDMELPDGQEIEEGQFGVHIMSSRHNPLLNDTYYVGEMARFSTLAAIIVPGTTPAMFE